MRKCAEVKLERRSEYNIRHIRMGALYL